MKFTKPFFLFVIATLSIYSCNNKQGNKVEHNLKDSTQVENSKVLSDTKEENVKFSIENTIKKSKTYFFSNSDSQDLFVLTINPGPIENSTSEFKIITEKNEVIYQETFRTYYFIKGIYEPARVPTGSQKVYEDYMEKYRKSLTLNQYKSYFKESLDSFFEYAVSPQKMTHDDFKDWEDEITDQEFRNEVLKDSTVNIIDLTCFDCDEGSKMIGYSKKKNMVKTLLEHD